MFKKELNEGFKTDYSKTTKTVSKNQSNVDKITIIFEYDESNPQYITYNGKQQKYTYLFFEITSNNERTEIILGLNTYNYISSSTLSYHYFYTAKANFSQLYNYTLGLINK